MQIPSNSKIRIFSDQVIVAATGAVGLSQRLDFHVEAAVKGSVFRNLKTLECATNISTRFLTDCQKSFVGSHPQFGGINFGAVLGALVENKPCLVEYATTDFQPEVKQGKLFFVSMGSGQSLADPFLAFISRVLWNNAIPTVKDAKFGVYWVLDHTIKLAPGGVGGPIKIAVLQSVDGKWKAEELPEIQEQAEYISELEAHIGSFAQKAIQNAQTSPIPGPPTQPSP